MNEKQIIFTLAAVTFLIIIGIIINDGEKEEGEIGISFGEECSEHEDCGYSFRTCKNGGEASCKNGCIYGRCTKCVPFCPGESECGNVTCSDSVRICPDGKKVRCANYCDLVLGECSSCVPECDIAVTEDINYQLKDEGIVVDAVPCIDVGYIEKTEIIKRNLTEIKLPEGYSIVMEPFKVECDGALDMTLNIPETYTDVKVLRCKGKECNPTEVRYIRELMCGGKISREFLREKEYLEPKLMPIKIKEVSSDVISGGEIRSDKYNVVFSGDFKDLDVTLSMPKEKIEEAKNPSLKITGTPVVINVGGEVRDEVNSTITMPYVNLEGFEEDSIGMYVKREEGWRYIGGEVNKEDKIVTATIADADKYLDEEGEMKVALMAILCVSCYDSSLTKVYQPEKGSEDVVVLIHGFDPEPNTYQPLIDDIRLTNQPFEVFTFDYPSSQTMEESVNELMSILEKNHANYKSIYIVAHSLGGLIAQQALYNSYLKNKKSLENKELLMYSYLDKVRKVILAGALNEGSPVIEVYSNLFEDLINKEEDFLFNLNSKVVDELVKGVITPRVPGVEYRVIAGTRPYEFNLLFFGVTTGGLAKIYEKNDGIITVKSAQHIGDGYVDDMCENYWELNVTHTELIDDPIARKIIGRIISEDIFEGGAVLGHNKYFDLSLSDCSAEDSYIVIGRRIKEERVLDESGCSCGNGYCGEGEDEVNCPSDCARFLSESRKAGLFAFLVLIVISFLATYEYATHRRLSHPHLKKMVEHIRDNYDIVPGEGCTEEQIRGAFLSRGWPERIVDDSIRLLKKEFHHTYHKPLKNHVNKHLRKGYTEEQIKGVLVNAGWRAELIDKIFRDEELEPGFRLKETKKRGHRIRLVGKGKYFGLDR